MRRLTVMDDQPARVAFDLDGYTRRTIEGPCFVCSFVAGHPDYAHHVLYEDDETIAFLSRYPTLVGYSLVAPKAHVEDWVSELPAEAFVRFQLVVRAVAAALAATLPTERMYTLSLGSRQGNAHLHWHVAPLPPGVPYDRQQFHALMSENGVLDVDETRQADLARRVRASVRTAPGPPR